MHLFPSRNPDKRAFTLIELIVVIVVLGILATFAIVGFRATIDRSTDAKQRARTQSVLREARTLYVQKIYQDPSYTWQQAIIDATADLPTFRTNAFADGVSATGGTNLNTGTNGWTLEVDSGSGVYSSVSSELVFKVQSSTLYVASYNDATGNGVFGYVSQETPPVVWTASCSGSSCDAESATLGTPAGGAYAPGTTASLLPTLSYSSTAFSLSGSSQVLSPTVTGSPTSFSYTGTLPAGVSFNTTTGVFTGPSAWNFQIASIATGTDHTCAVTTSGGAKCWGLNNYGQLGDGTTTNRLTPVNVSGLTSGVAAISVGTNHTCAMTTSGGAKCWGTNYYGELGDGTTTDRLTPVNVSGLTSGVASISVGSLHTCAVTTSGGAKCWGHNGTGQLGDGTTTDRLTPVNVSGLTSGVASISAGSLHTCAVTTSGGAKCWGYNNYGQLGDGTFGYESRTTPVNVSGLTSGVASIATGTNHTCAVTTSGGAKCWGYNFDGYLGDGTTGTNRLTPVDVSGLTTGVASISVGRWHTCAVTTSGGAKCWGTNYYGELGDGTTTFRTTPVDVSGLTSGVAAFTGQIGAFGSHTCAMTTSGGVKCWGTNYYGELGDGTSTNRLTPVDVSGHTGNAGFPASITVTATNASGSTTTSVALSVS